jgi:hypothetical protein
MLSGEKKRKSRDKKGKCDRKERNVIGEMAVLYVKE